MPLHERTLTPRKSTLPISTARCEVFSREREVTAHVADIKTLNPPPERVVGALTTGEFS